MKRNPAVAARRIDAHVGQRLRSARKIAGMTQTSLGAKLGLSFQLIQKFENGDVRVSAGRLLQLSQILGVPVEYFYEGAPRAVDGGEKHARIFDLAEFSDAKSACMRLIAIAEETDVGPLRTILERLLRRSN